MCVCVCVEGDLETQASDFMWGLKIHFLCNSSIILKTDWTWQGALSLKGHQRVKSKKYCIATKRTWPSWFQNLFVNGTIFKMLFPTAGGRDNTPSIGRATLHFFPLKYCDAVWVAIVLLPIAVKIVFVFCRNQPAGNS